MQLTALSLALTRAGLLTGFSPISLFSAGEPGVWYDPSDLTTMFQDAAGTTPVTAVEQPVGLILDKSRGLVLGPELVVNGGFATDTDWTKGTGWSISGGLAANSGPASNSNLTATSITLVTGKTYLFSFDLTSVTGSGVNIFLGGTYLGAKTTAGTYTGRLFCASSASGLSVICLAGAVCTIDNISVRELPGAHASQTTATSRPVLSARYNLLTKTEQFDAAGWGKDGATVTPNVVAAPDGTATSDLLVETAAAGNHRASQSLGTLQAQTLTVSIRHKAGVGVRNLDFAIVGGSNFVSTVFNPTNGAVVAVNDVPGAVFSGKQSSVSGPDAYGFYTARITVNLLSAATVNVIFGLTNGTSNSYTGDGASGIYIWGASLVPADQSALPYQRVNTAADYDAGPAFPLYLKFDGIDDGLVTPTITPNIDRAQVFAGVRKLSDAATGILAELSASSGANSGVFVFGAPWSPTSKRFSFNSNGNAGAVAEAATTDTVFNAPTTSVLTGFGDISGDLATLRVNGTQAAQSTADQGTGNYLAYPLFIGRRNNATLPFNGHLHSLIVRFGPTLTEAQITQTETYVAGKTGVVIDIPVTANFVTTDAGDQVTTDAGDLVTID